MSETERLLSYYPDFDADVLERVEEVSEAIRPKSWDDIRADLPDNEIYSPAVGKAIEVKDIIPEDGYDETWVYHLPLSNPLADHMELRIAALAIAAPNKRIITVGSPSGPNQGYGKIYLADFYGVSKGRMRPLVDPILQYLKERAPKEPTSQIGFSYGAEKAVVASQYADRYDLEVQQGLFMEAFSVVNRGPGMVGLLSLLKDFVSAADGFQEYLDNSSFPASIEAGKKAAEKSRGLLGFGLGLVRPSNIATELALIKDGLAERLSDALTRQPNMSGNLLWADTSELSIDDLMANVAMDMVCKFGKSRFKSTVVPGQTHGMGDDVFLHTGLVLQGLK